jgi:hypothetical protein
VRRILLLVLGVVALVLRPVRSRTRIVATAGDQATALIIPGLVISVLGP